MNHNFCRGCYHGAGLPECIIRTVPKNAYIEDIIDGSKLSYEESFVCHKESQSFSEDKLSISDNCNNCGLCYIVCPYTSDDSTTFFTSQLEEAVFNDLKKTDILFTSLFPDALVASEVQLDGLSRNKRIDLVIRKESCIYLIKLLKTTNKIPFYTRSYNEVIAQYSTRFHDLDFINICLVPASKSDAKVSIDANILDISGLYNLLGGN